MSCARTSVRSPSLRKTLTPELQPVSHLCLRRVLVTAVHRPPPCQRLSRIGERRGGRRVLEELYSSWVTRIELHGHHRVLCRQASTLALRRCKFSGWTLSSLSPSRQSIPGILVETTGDLAYVPLTTQRFLVVRRQTISLLHFHTLQCLEFFVQTGYVCSIFFFNNL